MRKFLVVVAVALVLSASLMSCAKAEKVWALTAEELSVAVSAIMEDPSYQEDMSQAADAVMYAQFTGSPVDDKAGKSEYSLEIGEDLTVKWKLSYSGYASQGYTLETFEFLETVPENDMSEMTWECSFRISNADGLVASVECSEGHFLLNGSEVEGYSIPEGFLPIM